MKNYFKKQIKKSISLMLAVLMVLSCWVWVAPTEAEAADSPDEGYYYVQVIGNLTDWEDDANVAKNDWIVDYNGGSATFTGTSVYNGGSNKNDYVLASGWVPGFPTGVKNVYKMGCGGEKWRIEVPTVYVGNGNDIKIKIGGRTDGFNAEQTSETTVNVFSPTPGDKMYTETGITPVAKTVRNVSSADLTIPGIGTTTNAKSGEMTADVYDQYGVKLLNVKPSSFYIGDSTNKNKFAMDTHGVGVNASAQVEVSAEAQKKLGGVEVLYIYGQYQEIVSDPAYAGELTLTYPEYTMNIAPNGQTGTTGAVMTMSDGSTQTTDWSTEGIYGSNGTAATYPTAVAEKTGYTFMGYWTNEQPTTGNASFNALEADFATPVSSDDFVDKYGGTEGGDYVTVGDKTYYNAGQQWNPENSRGIIGDSTYHGWWISTDIPVKFYDIDGKYLGTRTYKYGTKPAAAEYPDPREDYNAGAYNYSIFSGVWQDIRGTKVTEGSYTFGIDGLMELTLTPTYTNKQYKDKYTINFIKPTDGRYLKSYSADYRHVLSGDEIPGATDVVMPQNLTNDIAYSYEFAGWTTEAPAGGKHYHIIEEDDTAFALNSDWVVRDEATYYPVYRSFVKTYVVQYNYTDSTGTDVSKAETVKYGSTISTPSYVNATYASGGMGHNLEGWIYTNNSNQTVTLSANDSLVFNSDNIQIAGNNLADGVDEQAIVFTADYDEGTPMPYTVTFKYKGANGEDLKIISEVYHNAFITQDTVDRLSISETYDDGEALYTFANTWKVTEGAADKIEYTKDEFTSFSPTSHVTFEAVYGEGVPFYTVTYIDGPRTYRERILAGLNVPAWVVDGEEYEPSMADSDIGTYEFAGWYDEAQKDADFNETNGTKYTTASIVNGDLTLYPQFKFSPFKFSIVFWNYDKSVQLAAGEYEYGQNFGDAFYRAQRAAQLRDADETYSYTFIGWDQPYNEDNLVCEGKDVEFVALYKPGYIYYNANWYSSEAMTGTPLAITKHTYDSKVYAPSVELDIEEGKAFDGWYYKDANGAEQPYVRGMKITAEMSFYAKYKDAAITYTVTTVVGDKETKYTVAKGDKANAIADPNAGWLNDEQHNKFDGWFTEDGEAFDIANTAITEDIKIIAKFTESEHDFTNKELIDAPTYYAKGKEAKWCSCDPTKTRTETEIAELTDTVKPTGTIYLGTQGKWSSTDAVGAAATDNDDVKYFANDDTDILLIVNDTGDVDEAYNPSGIGKGIKMIRGFISKGVYSQDNQDVEMSEVVTIFEDDSQDLNNAANYVIKLGQYGGLEDGETYVAYYYVQDKAGNVLNTNVRTAKFVYDNTAPTITVEGKSNVDTVSGTPTYCATATVTDIEDGATVTVNGEVVTVADGKYVINTAGNYVITVADKAGNKTSKKIVVAEDHTLYTSEVLSTCDEDGYLKETCLVCGYVKTNKTYKAPGHEWETSFVPATCDENGYNIKVCNECGEEEKTEYINGVDGELIQAALGHSYAKDDEENIIYTIVTKATCSVKGKQIANCERCGAGTLTEEIPVDPDAHTFGAIKTLKPTCTEPGKTYKTCKYCYEIEDVEVLPATGHQETKWVVTTAATCGEAGEETEKCKKCDAVIGTREIPETGRHIFAVSEDPEKTFDATADKEGQITRYCVQCGYELVEKVAKIEKYTVTFVGEDGTTVLETIEDVVKGTTIAEDYKWTVGEGEEAKEHTIPEHTKADDDVKGLKFAFAGWVDEAGKTVKLPFDVTGDITLKATFTESTKIYTHLFKVPTTWTTTLSTDGENYSDFAAMMGAIGDSRVPLGNPTFSLTDKDQEAELKKLYTFEFKGWSTTGAAGDIVTDFTIAGDATFYAVFEAIAIKYKVTYYNGTEFVWQTTVNGGDSVTFGGEVPTKDYDTDNHYTFEDWYTDVTLKTVYEDDPITSDTKLYAKFAGTEHVYGKTGTVIQEADCLLPELTEYTCSCGHKKTEQTAEASGHTPADAVTEEKDGVYYSVVYCSVCNAEISRTKTSVTVVFKNYDGVRLDTLNLNIGDAIAYKGETPARADDEKNTYTFTGWYVEGDKEETLVTLGNASADVTYIAKFTATARTFRVSYLDLDNNVLQTTAGIEYGEVIPEYNGEEPTKASDDKNHYTFKEWSVSEDTVVTKDIRITPEFEAAEHVFDDGAETGATCTEYGGIKYTCACGYSKIEEGAAPPTGHDYVETDRKEATRTEEGYIKYECSVCGEEKTEIIPISLITITVTVKDTNGNPRAGVDVALLDAATNLQVEGTRKQTTDANGVVKFTVKPGNYKAFVVGDGSYTDVAVDEDGNVSGGAIEVEPEVEAPGCSCSCHRGDFWGTIFRLLHKFIRLFTGRIGCCECPDSRY